MFLVVMDVVDGEVMIESLRVLSVDCVFTRASTFSG